MGLEKFESKIIRGHIIKILHVAYPGPASLQLLEITLADRQCNTSPASIRGYIDYLEDKGYVEVNEGTDDLARLTRILVKLTAKGIDLFEGNIPKDPGVFLDE